MVCELLQGEVIAAKPWLDLQQLLVAVGAVDVNDYRALQPRSSENRESKNVRQTKSRDDDDDDWD